MKHFSTQRALVAALTFSAALLAALCNPLSTSAGVSAASSARPAGGIIIDSRVVVERHKLAKRFRLAGVIIPDPRGYAL